jgi:hypothetical protein
MVWKLQALPVVCSGLEICELVPYSFILSFVSYTLSVSSKKNFYYTCRKVGVGKLRVSGGMWHYLTFLCFPSHGFGISQCENGKHITLLRKVDIDVYTLYERKINQPQKVMLQIKT